MHIPSLVKIHWRLLKLSSCNEKRMDGPTYDWQMDGRMDRHMDIQHETIIPHHYCMAGYKKGYNSHNNWQILPQIEWPISYDNIPVYKIWIENTNLFKKSIEKKTFFEEEIGP